MSYPYAVSKTYVPGEILTASDLNSSDVKHSNQNIPEDIDDYSVNTAEMQTTVDPYPGASPSLATGLEGELSRLRYILAQITGETYWYVDPDTTIAALNTEVTDFTTLLGSSTAQIRLPDGSLAVPSLAFASDQDTGARLNSAGYFQIVAGGVAAAQFSAEGLQISLGQLLAGNGTVGAPALSAAEDLNTGLYFPTADTLAVSLAGSLHSTFNSTGIVLNTGVIHTKDGSVSAPGYGFADDPNSGLYRIGTDNIGITTAGSLRWSINSSGHLVSASGLQILGADGSLSNPTYAFSTDPDTGIRLNTAGYLSIVAGGAAVGQFSSTGLQISGSGQLMMPAGTTLAPSFTFATDLNTGILNPAADTIAVSTGNSISFQIDKTATAGFTRMLIYDIDNGTLERVRVGAADSGGAGYKVLRIAN